MVRLTTVGAPPAGRGTRPPEHGGRDLAGPGVPSGMDTTLPPLDRPSSIVVLLAGQVAALCTADRVYPATITDRLPPGHPDRALIDVKCLYAGAIIHGDLEGPYDDHQADRLARDILENEAHDD